MKYVKRKRFDRVGNIFSLRRRKRIKGAGIILESYLSEFTDMNGLLHTHVHGEFDVPKVKQTHLHNHLQSLYQGFVGKPMLVFYHALLIVLIRRGYKPEQVFEEFLTLWTNYSDELYKYLDLRWLVSAADTFVDYHPSSAVRALMLNAVIAVNTVKLYETERWLQGENAVGYPQEKLQALKENKQPLFSGLETFTVGQDDTLINMKRRMQVMSEQKPLLKLPLCVLDKLKSGESVFARFYAVHHHKRTQW